MQGIISVKWQLTLPFLFLILKSSLLHYWQLLTPWNYYKTLLTIFCSNNFLKNDGIQEFSTSVNKKFTVPSFSPILNIVKFITSLTHRSSRMLIADSTFICPFTTLHDNSNRAFFITLDSLPRKFFSFITLHCLILKKNVCIHLISKCTRIHLLIMFMSEILHVPIYSKTFTRGFINKTHTLNELLSVNSS